MTTLKGKAFFQVKKMHGIPFRVKTDFLDVEVLGTSFLIDVARKEKPECLLKPERCAWKPQHMKW